jgi:VanZ family protein
LSAAPGTNPEPYLFHGEDKVAHVLLYLPLGIAVARGAVRSSLTGPWWVPPAVGLLYAASDEWHQTFVPGRDANLGDLAADTLGFLLGYTLFFFLLRRGSLKAPAPSSP